MKKKELIKALSKIEEGIADVKNILSAESSDSIKTESKEESSVEEEPVADSDDNSFSRDELMNMKYNDLKKLGKTLGVKCTGTREEIVERILNTPVEAGADEVEPSEDAGEEKVVPISKVKKAKKEEPATEDDGVEEQYLELARTALEENSIDEVVEVLEDAGVKLSAMQKKKKDVVMTKLAEAFQNGLIEADEDDEDDEDEAGDDTEDVSDEDTLTEDSYFEQYDPEGINNPESMSKKRLKAVQKLVAGIIKSWEDGELTQDDMEEELGDIITDEDSDLLGDDYEEEDLLMFYIEMKKRFIDDDGEEVGQGEPYEVNEENFCCGHQLAYDKKGKKYICPVCEEEYEE